jgi:hypothetical protein
MVGVLLALILIAVLRNGMQLANLGGATQDIVIGGLLIGAILAGNVARAVRDRGVPFRRPGAFRKEVTRSVEPAVSVEATLDSQQGGST